MAGLRVLIIEDNPANLELMKYLLDTFGYTVFTADDGRQGLAAAVREQPALIICDMQLPDIDGFEVARALRDSPGLASIPLVAVTALAMVGDRDRVLAAGFDGYLSKPIDPETFVGQVESYLPGRQHSAAQFSHADSEAPEPGDEPLGATILVVDNLPVNLELARSILVPSGYRVITAGGVAAAIALAREPGCHLILSDVCMNNESGYDFLRAIKADPQLQRIPFVLITSTMMDRKDNERGLAMGAARYLRRPMEPESLLAEIRACLTEAGVS